MIPGMLVVLAGQAAASSGAPVYGTIEKGQLTMVEACNASHVGAIDLLIEGSEDKKYGWVGTVEARVDAIKGAVSVEPWTASIADDGRIAFDIAGKTTAEGVTVPWTAVAGFSPEVLAPLATDTEVRGWLAAAVKAQSHTDGLVVDNPQSTTTCTAATAVVSN